MKKTRKAGIYFLLAPPHHGAAEFSAVLNLHPRIMAFGTANPQRGIDENCSCGVRVSACPFWSEIWGAIDLPEEYPSSHWLPTYPVALLNDHANQALMALLATLSLKTGAWPWRFIREPALTFYDLHTRFLRAAQIWHPHAAFVDAQGSVLKLMTMAAMDFPIRGIIHLVRDPGGLAAWSKRFYPERPIDGAVRLWTRKHKQILMAKRLMPKIPYWRIPYESLMTDIATESKNIIKNMDLNDHDWAESTLARDKNHLLGLSTADQAGDLVWQNLLSKDEQNRVLRAAGRLFQEFGYKSES